MAQLDGDIDIQAEMQPAPIEYDDPTPASEVVLLADLLLRLLDRIEGRGAAGS